MCLTCSTWLLADSGWAAFDEQSTFSGASAALAPPSQQAGSEAAAKHIQPSAAAGPGDARSHSPPIDIPLAAGGAQSPPGEGEDPAMSQYSSFQFWRSPPAMLSMADEAELGDIREDLEGGLPPAGPSKPHVD